MRVLAYDPYVPAAVMKRAGVEAVELEHLLLESDFVSLHADLTADSRHMLGAEQFQLMKPTSYLVERVLGRETQRSTFMR